MRRARRPNESPARPAPTVPSPTSTAKRNHCRSLPAGDCCGGHDARTNRRQDRLLQRQDPPPRQSEAAVGACLQAIASAGTAPERIAGRLTSFTAEALRPGRVRLVPTRPWPDTLQSAAPPPRQPPTGTTRLNRSLQDKIRALEATGAARELSAIRRGIEKESLRVGPDGVIASTPHPAALGSALSHDWITTDYSEALLEFITPVYRNIEEMLEFLTDLHVFTYANIGEEILWT